MAPTSTPAARWVRASGTLADLLRAGALVSAVASYLWYTPEGAVRFGLLFLVLLVPRAVHVARPFAAAFCATLLLATWAAVAHWYSAVSWMDEVVHLLTTGAAAATAYLVLVRLHLMPDLQDGPLRRHRSSVALLTVASGLAVAALWEVYEWVVEQLAPQDIRVGYTDTVLDMAAGGVGSLLAGVALALWARGGRGTGRREHGEADGHDAGPARWSGAVAAAPGATGEGCPQPTTRR